MDSTTIRNIFGKQQICGVLLNSIDWRAISEVLYEWQNTPDEPHRPVVDMKIDSLSISSGSQPSYKNLLEFNSILSQIDFMVKSESKSILLREFIVRTFSSIAPRRWILQSYL